jgi:hypothetical protein
MKKLSLHQLVNSNFVSQSDVHTTVDRLANSIIEANNINVNHFDGNKKDMFRCIFKHIEDFYSFDIVKTKVATHILCNPK